MKTMRCIPEAELNARREMLLRHVREARLRGVVLFDAAYIRYFADFNFLATERPVAFAANASGDLMVFVPEFEVERVRAETPFQRVECYPEYPGFEHPMIILGRALEDMGIQGAVAVDQDGYPGILGYRGPALSAVMESKVHVVSAFIEDMMALKSEVEIGLIRESATWCAHAHRLLQQYTRLGTTEAEASLRAGHGSTLAMLEALGTDHDDQQGSSDGASAGYRGQIGLRSSWAHAVAHNIEFKEGDVLVSETSAPVCGYHAELERAMVIGRPSDEMIRLFDHMMAARQVAFDTLRPGVLCAEVDRAVLAYFESNDLLPYWRQHTGHAIGIRNHEAPFLDIGDDTRIEPGMVFTVEPGVYSSHVGGFRHSDTVAVTADGIEVLTHYPSDLESLLIPV